MNSPLLAIIIVIALIVGGALSIMNKACKTGGHRAWCAPMSTIVRHHVETRPPAKSVPDMPQAQSFYDGRLFVQGLILWFVMGRIDQGLTEGYKLPTEVPPELLTLVRKLDERDWLFPSIDDRNLLGD